MKYFFFVFMISILFTGCQLGQSPQTSEQLQPGLHKGVVKEVLQTSNYTYLLVTENKSETWLALPGMEAHAGETYYYKDGMEMKNFESKELGRTFETVYFIESVSKSPQMHTADPMAQAGQPQSPGAMTTAKQSINISPAEGGITIGELVKNKAEYSGKTVKIKGQVMKFNSGIMSKNWVHLQDGSEYEGKYDLTVTTDVEVALGQVVTFEGVIVLNKDFGYGYFYEILLEDGKLIKEM